MDHIPFFALENFRVFKDLTQFDFAPITILVGPNSSGKSSLLKALLLADENKEDMLKGSFPFSSGRHDLGSFERMMNDPTKPIAFEFPIELNHIPLPIDSQVARLRLEYKLIAGNPNGFFCDDDEPEPQYYAVKYDHLYLSNISIKVHGKTLIEFGSKNEYDKLYFDQAFFLSLFKPLAENTGEIKGFSDLMLSSEMSEEENKRLYIDLIFKSHFPELFPDIVDFYNNAQENGKKMIKRDKTHSATNTPFTSLKDDNGNSILNLYDFVSNEKIAVFIHNSVFPFNIHPKVEYRHDDSTIHNLHVDNKAISFKETALKNLQIDYVSSQRPQIKRVYTHEDKESTVAKLLSYSNESSDFIKKWSKSFGLSKEIEPFLDKELLMKGIRVNDRPLVELGYGISQLSILLLAINNLKNTLIIEEPEANLHPAFQSKLADMFADAIKTLDKRFIIETHSEYMIRKFQYLVAKGKMKKEDIIIYYFNDPNNIPTGEKQVKKIEILEDGSLSDDFGSGFFDEATNWKFELMELRKAQKN